MRILIVTNSASGLLNFRKHLIKGLLSLGHELFALMPINGKSEEFEELGVSLIDTNLDRRGVNPLKDLFLIRRYFYIVKRVNPNLILTYTIKPNVYGGIVARITKTKYAANITGLGTAFEKKGWIKNLAVLFNKVGLKDAKVVFFENDANFNYFIQNNIIKPTQGHVLHGAGVDIEHFSLKQYPEDDAEFRFLFIGRIMREKGFVELISALRRLRSNGFNVSLSVLGGFDEENLRDLVDECESEGWLYYHGVQSDVRPFIENAHCFVLPSYHEGMANTNLECAASGRPVITSNIPGCKESIIEGESGYLCEPKNVDSLYTVMAKMCILPRKKREAMGVAGRQHIEMIFDKRKVVEETINVLMDRNCK